VEKYNIYDENDVRPCLKDDNNNENNFSHGKIMKIIYLV